MREQSQKDHANPRVSLDKDKTRVSQGIIEIDRAWDTNVLDVRYRSDSEALLP